MPTRDRASQQISNGGIEPIAEGEQAKSVLSFEFQVWLHLPLDKRFPIGQNLGERLG